MLYTILKNEIKIAEGKIILLKRLLSSIEAINIDMPAFLQSPQGQLAFYSVITKLVSEKVIKAIGKKPDASNGLHLRYRILNNEKKDTALIAKIIKSIEPPASIDYYIKNPRDFLHDKSDVEVISNFLKKRNNECITVNERAYELFHDEKFFKGDDKRRSRGEVVLKRLGLDYASLDCEETPEPFFSFQKTDFFLRKPRRIFIIENKDTFWSFKKQTMDKQSYLQSDMIIYGEGKKILSSFRFVDEYDIDPDNDVFNYFGDLDPEGVSIYCRLKDIYDKYKIQLFCEGYQAIFEIGTNRESVKTPRQQKINERNIDLFVKEFDNQMGSKIKRFLLDGYYIPQEALSSTKMKERFGAKRNV